MAHDPDIPLTFDPDDVVTRYRYALGTFINGFAWMEIYLFDLLCATAGVSEQIGKALFSGHRAEQMVQFIRRCHEAESKVVEPWLDRALSHINLLSTMRNQVVHFTTIGMEENYEAVFATSHYRLPEKSARETTFKPRELLDMARDAHVCIAYLTTAADDMRHPGRLDDLIAEMKACANPWRYKSPQPTSTNRKSRAVAQKQPRQRQSSPE